MELIGQLDALGIKPSSDEQPNDTAEDWEDVDDSDDDDDVEMSQSLGQNIISIFFTQSEISHKTDIDLSLPPKSWLLFTITRHNDDPEVTAESKESKKKTKKKKTHTE